MLREPKVIARLEYLRGRVEAVDETIIALRRIRQRQRLETVATLDRTLIFDDNGALKSISDWPETHRALIETIEPTKNGPKAVLEDLLAQPWFAHCLARVERDIRVVTDVDMPYVAGSDAELECVFIDRHS
jgi:hypothetical protein